MPSPSLTSRFKHRHVNTLYQASSWCALVISWFSSIVDCVCKHAHTKYYSLIHCDRHARFLLLALETRTYTGSSPVTNDDASCFNDSWLSFNISAANFWYNTFIEAAVHPEKRGSHRNCVRNSGRGYARDKINI